LFQILSLFAARFEVLTAMKDEVVVLWVLKRINPEDGGSSIPRNVGILLHYTA
jgi:hypothetical protein